MIGNFVGAPVRGKHCYGRDQFIDLVWTKLSFGNVLLAAPRRFGKTSIMYRLLDEPRWEYKLIHADLEDLDEPGDLIAELLLKLASDSHFSRAVEKLSFFPKAAWKAFRKNISEVELYAFKIKLREQFSTNWKDQGDELFRRIASSAGMVVFILDELPMMIDRMARSGREPQAKSMLRWLRGLRQAPQNTKLRFLVAGSVGIGHVLSGLGEAASFNDFEQLKVEPFPDAIGNSFLTELAKGASISLSAGSRQKMLDAIGAAVPYFLQALFSELQKATLYDQKSITPAKVEQIYREKLLGVDCKTYFEHYYLRLSLYFDPHTEKAAKRILRTLAIEGALSQDACYQLYKKENGKCDPDGFNRLVTTLESEFYTSVDSKTRYVAFSCKILRDWWLRHYALQVED